MVGITNPYRRTARPAIGGDYFGRRAYIFHRDYADNPHNYIQAFLLLQEDLQRLFQYVEPADRNNDCYSFRIHEILLRACIEVEANCKAILTANGYSKSGNWNRDDYRKVEKSHRLSGFKVRIPYWDGVSQERQPFAAWNPAIPPGTPAAKLKWYDDYNATKHDRQSNFRQAAFGSAVDAACGVLVLLSAQFTDQSFSPTASPWGRGTVNGWRNGIGEFFTVSYPTSWADADHYSADWDAASPINYPY